MILSSHGKNSEETFLNGSEVHENNKRTSPLIAFGLGQRNQPAGQHQLLESHRFGAVSWWPSSRDQREDALLLKVKLFKVG